MVQSMETTTIDVLRLLVRTLEQAEEVMSFNELPDDYRVDALEIGKQHVVSWERSLKSVDTEEG